MIAAYVALLFDVVVAQRVEVLLVPAAELRRVMPLLEAFSPQLLVVHNLETVFFWSGDCTGVLQVVRAAFLDEDFAFDDRRGEELEQVRREVRQVEDPAVSSAGQHLLRQEVLEVELVAF